MTLRHIAWGGIRKRDAANTLVSALQDDPQTPIVDTRAFAPRVRAFQARAPENVDQDEVYKSIIFS